VARFLDHAFYYFLIGEFCRTNFLQATHLNTIFIALPPIQINQTLPGMRNLFCIFCLFPAVLFLNSCNQNDLLTEREINFNSDWKFVRADVSGAEKPDFDDSVWRTLILPHDYSIEDLAELEGIKQIGPFSEESGGGISTGHVVGGTAWYRKHFTLDKADEGKIVKILFDGVYMNTDVWLNGQHLGNHPYGYTAFSFDLTGHLRPAGEENVLAVQVKNEGQNSRWYSGSGIYRNVTLLKTNPVHVDLWGIFVRTKFVSPEMATIAVDVDLINETTKDKRVTLKMEFRDSDGNYITHFEDGKELAGGQKYTFEQEFGIPEYRLWSIENPELYTLFVQLVDGKKVLDEVTETFGIRTIEFSTEKGFLLNGESVLLKGSCMHHDNGPLGSAAFDAAEFRRVKIMKENGFNAIRSAHNPPSKAFLDACDQLGMLVMDEAFDMWQVPKKPQDYHLYFNEWWKKDLESMVLRDRNHPSIIIWSVGNEIKERADSSGLEIFQNLRAKVLEVDKTRPVTQAICGFWETPGRPWEDSEPAFAQMDVHGYNYKWQQYEPDHAKFPNRIMIGTESFPMEALENWQMVEKHPYVIGDFVWTGMDYFGESGIGSSKLDNEDIPFLPPWPWFNAHCGDISVLGHKKPQMYFRDVVWRNSELEILVHEPIPEGRKEIISNWGWPSEMKSWNWEGHEGTLLQVSVYTRCDEVRLELNGNEIGTKPVSEETKLTVRFDVPYQPGELVAIGLKNGQETVREVLKTAGKPARLKISTERDTISASYSDLAYFRVEVLDENGLLVPDAEIPVEFKIEGVGTLQAVGNGNPTNMKSFQQPRVLTYRGKGQVVVRSSENPGEISVTARSEGLDGGTETVTVVKI
jgi:beta-galactosidase